MLQIRLFSVPESVQQDEFSLENGDEMFVSSDEQTLEEVIEDPDVVASTRLHEPFMPDFEEVEDKTENCVESSSSTFEGTSFFT